MTSADRPPPHRAEANDAPQPMKTSPDRQVLIVADAHLPLDDRCGGERDREDFLALLRRHRDRTGTLLLLGDIFDFWYEWRHVVPKRAFPILFEIREMIRDGVDVHYFAGNHDFQFRGMLTDTVGMTLHMDEWTAEFDGRRYFFHHGDGLAASDRNYRKMKGVFRSGWAQALFGGAFHPDLALDIGRRTSQEGRKRHDRGSRELPSPEEYMDAARRIFRRGHDVVVIGHTHRQMDAQLEGGLFHNAGPFLRERWYSVIDGGPPRAEVWS